MESHLVDTLPGDHYKMHARARRFVEGGRAFPVAKWPICLTPRRATRAHFDQ